MRLYFLRHGDAGDPAAWRGDDFDRPLSDLGHERTAKEAKALVDLGVQLDAIVTSPLLRAKQTAEIVAKKLKCKRVDTDERIANEQFDVQSLGSLLRDHANADGIMLVGHEPTMSQVIGELIGGARLELKKGAVACVELPSAKANYGTLLWLAPPKILSS